MASDICSDTDECTALEVAWSTYETGTIFEPYVVTTTKTAGRRINPYQYSHFD